MADITPPAATGQQTIQSYGGGRFLISGRAYEGSVLVFPDATLPWPVSDSTAITVDTLSPVLLAGEGVRVLLVGCGKRRAILEMEVLAALRAAGIGVEVMDTGAACRTFNVLAAEGRAVAAALVAVD